MFKDDADNLILKNQWIVFISIITIT